MITMILLVVVFLAVVVPQALSARAERNQQFLESIQFHAGEVMAGRADSASEPAAARQPPSAAARRRMVFAILLGSMAIAAATAVAMPAKATLGLMLAVDNCFLAYLGLFVRWRDARVPATASTQATGPILAPTAVQPVLRAS